MYDYDKSREAHCLDNIGWRYSPLGKKVILTGVEWLFSEDELYLKYCFSHLGHCEWEVWMARMLWTAIKEAFESGKVDITPLFDCDLIGYYRIGDDPRKDTREYLLKAEEFRKRLMTYVFDVVEETNEELRVKFK